MPALPTSRETPRRSLNDKAYEHLRQAILGGDLPVGTIIAETKVAEDLGISKTPVRQALQLLRTEGLLEVGPRRQLVVRGFSAAHRNEVLRVPRGSRGDRRRDGVPRHLGRRHRHAPAAC